MIPLLVNEHTSQNILLTDVYPPSEALPPVAPTDKPVAMLLLLEPNKTRNTRVKALDIWSLGIACCGS